MAQPVHDQNLTNAGAANQTGDWIDTWGHPNWRGQVVVTTAPCTLVWALESSPDKTNAQEEADSTGIPSAELATATLGAVRSLVFSGRAARYIRLRIKSHTAGAITGYLALNGNPDMEEWAKGDRTT